MTSYTDIISGLDRPDRSGEEIRGELPKGNVPEDPDRSDEDDRRSGELTMELGTWGRVLLPYVGRSATVQGTVVVKCECKNEHFTLGPMAIHPDPVDLDRVNRTGLTVNRCVAKDGGLIGDHNGSINRLIWEDALDEWSQIDDGRRLIHTRSVMGTDRSNCQKNHTLELRRELRRGGIGHVPENRWVSWKSGNNRGK